MAAALGVAELHGRVAGIAEATRSASLMPTSMDFGLAMRSLREASHSLRLWRSGTLKSGA